MLRKVDRILLRVPSLPGAVHFYTGTMGMRLIKQDKRLASLGFIDSDAELVLHVDPDLPAEAIYYLVDDVRDLYGRRAEMSLTFVSPPAQAARGWRATVKDPFGNILLILDRMNAGVGGHAHAVEDAKPAGSLFAGIETRVEVNRQALIEAYQNIGRTADDLPYTPHFESIFKAYLAAMGHEKPTRAEVWRHLLNLRKAGKLPKMGEAKSKPPEVSDEERGRLRQMLGKDIGKRDRLPYSERFDGLVDEFNNGQARPLSPHLVWRLVATLAK